MNLGRKKRIQIVLSAKGQSTLEFALLLPTVFFLLYMVTLAFRTNHFAVDHANLKHAQALKTFDHGNGTININGIDIPAGSLTKEAMPSGHLGSFLTPFLDIGKDMLLNLGLEQLTNNVSFLDGKTYISGFAKGASTTAARSLVESGKVDWNAAKWEGFSGALSSIQATEDFQGMDHLHGSKRELFGSALQTGAMAYTKSEGKWETIAPGMVSGALYSSAANQWFESGNDILKGAARGAVTSTVAGVFSGNVNLKDIGIATAMGGFQTKSVARAFPFSSWSGDPRNAATFSAANAAIGVLLTDGKMEDALYAASAGAFFSGQAQDKIAGDSGLRAFLASTTYTSAESLARGKELSAVGESALISATGAAAGYGINQIQLGMEKGLRSALGVAGVRNQIAQEAFIQSARPGLQYETGRISQTAVDGLVPLFVGDSQAAQPPSRATQPESAM